MLPLQGIFLPTQIEPESPHAVKHSYHLSFRKLRQTTCIQQEPFWAVTILFNRQCAASAAFNTSLISGLEGPAEARATQCVALKLPERPLQAPVICRPPELWGKPAAVENVCYP